MSPPDPHKQSSNVTYISKETLTVLGTLQKFCSPTLFLMQIKLEMASSFKMIMQDHIGQELWTSSCRHMAFNARLKPHRSALGPTGKSCNSPNAGQHHPRPTQEHPSRRVECHRPGQDNSSHQQYASTLCGLHRYSWRLHQILRNLQ